MIRIQQLSKSFGTQVLFEDVSFQVGSGERIGLIGRNGYGKTTLFKILLGNEVPDSGDVLIPRGYTVGHLSQRLEFNEPTVRAEVCSALPESDDGSSLEYRAEAALEGLGFTQEEFEKAPSELSGGFQVRLNLAKVLVSEPSLLLLDEPTNYLDIVSMRWLGRFLRAWRHELILITHDREFMDSVTTHTMIIHRAQTRKIQGPTDKLFEQIALEEEIHEKTRQNQQRDRKQQERFIERFRAKASKAKAVQSRIKLLDKQGNIDQLDAIHDLSFSFNAAPFPAKQILECHDLTFGFEEDDPLFKDLDFGVGARDRIAVIGRNGKGKTTLLRALTGELEPWGGKVRKHPSAQLSYFGQENVDRLDPERTIESEIIGANPDLGRSGARGVCGAMMFEGDDALKKIKVLSGGERSRVLLGRLLVSPANLLLLDEPTNHLDMQSTEGLIAAMQYFPGAIVMVTHSEMVLRAVATRLVIFDGGRTRVFDGGYDEFLEQVGWQEEEGSGRAAKPAKQRGVNRKELRRQRAEINAEKRTKLKPLLDKIAKIEGKITKLETESQEVDQALLEASTSGDNAQIAKLAKRSKDAKAKIEQLFEDLERATLQHDYAEEEFTQRLAQLGD
ncbi:MAG: ABC-F family ATP-binding cassette domain-containing protein [Planctomycetota bacterium]